MAFCVWWSYTTRNSGIAFLGAIAGAGLLDLSARAVGEKYLNKDGLFIVWSFLGLVAITTALASLGILQDGLGLLNH
jgi:hypothetical protein